MGVIDAKTNDRILALEAIVATHKEIITSLVEQVAKLGRVDRLSVSTENDPAAIASILGAFSAASEVEQGHLPLGLMARDTPEA